MTRNKYSLKREDFIAKQTDKLSGQIERAQNRFLKLLLESFISGMAVDEFGNLANDDNFFFLPSRLDKFYDDFLDDQIRPIMDGFTWNVDTLLKRNRQYFDTIKKSDNHDGIKDSVLNALGISSAGALGGSLLYSILANRDIIGAVKSVFMGATSVGLTITAFKSTVTDLVAKKDGGLLKSFFEEKLPDPYVKLDRFIGGKYAVDLQLNYAIYQGGIIGTSRPFCIERNNKVFSRDEIMKFGTSADEFGGYDDKATGHFQGKPDPYNPFIDIGGFRCRHAFDWISDELAFHLRPELAANRLN